jgi:hypothetical protein
MSTSQEILKQTKKNFISEEANLGFSVTYSSKKEIILPYNDEYDLKVSNLGSPDVEEKNIEGLSSFFEYLSLVFRNPF